MSEPKTVVQTVDSQWLYGFWYPALRSAEVRGSRLAAARLLSLPLVLGRTAGGAAFALRDSCPHRGIPLSYGSFDGQQVECCYHGWRFNATTGQCREIPSLTDGSRLKVERIHAQSSNSAPYELMQWSGTERQAEGPKHDPNLMLIDDADRPARWYFPIAGPVPLRWRS